VVLDGDVAEVLGDGGVDDGDRHDEGKKMACSMASIASCNDTERRLESARASVCSRRRCWHRPAAQ
jgi:hypothetical protein